jgi:hypothetical protein
MYYEEKMIDGVLMYRGTSDGEWKPVTMEMMTRRLTELRMNNDSLKEENETLRGKIKTVKRDDLLNIIKSRMDAEMCDLAEQYGIHHGDVSPHWQVQYDIIMTGLTNLLGEWIEDNSEYTVRY